MLAQQINDFLVASLPDPYCDECLAQELGSDRTDYYAAALGALDGFVREMGDCSECGKRRLVIHALAPLKSVVT